MPEINKKDIDIELIFALKTEITDRIKAILLIFPDDKELLLKHLAAASIHHALFMRDLSSYIQDKNIVMEDYEEEFLNHCGCKESKAPCDQ